MPTSAEVRLLTVTEAADILRTNQWSVTSACRDGRLRAYKPGRRWLVPADAIPEYLEAHGRPKAAQAAGPEPEPAPRKRKRRVS